MGTYCYKISRKSRAVRGTKEGKIYLAEFAYKCHSFEENDRHSIKRVAPTVRAWKKYLAENDMEIMDILFVMDFKHGAPVYRRHSIDWLDGCAEPGELVGHLERFPSGWTVKGAETRRFDVTFSPYDHCKHLGPMKVTVPARCERAAERIAQDYVRDGNLEHDFNYYSAIRPAVSLAQKSQIEILTMAKGHIKEMKGLTLTERVEVANAISQAMIDHRAAKRAS